MSDSRHERIRQALPEDEMGKFLGFVDALGAAYTLGRANFENVQDSLRAKATVDILASTEQLFPAVDDGDLRLDLAMYIVENAVPNALLAPSSPASPEPTEE